MKRSILVLGVLLALSGCVAVPVDGYIPQTRVSAEVVVYPQVEVAYIWDPVIARFYFVDRGRRYYMAPGWEYRRHGVPRGYYHDHDDRGHRER